MGCEDKYKEMLEKSICGENLRWMSRRESKESPRPWFDGWRSSATGRTVSVYWVGVGEITSPEMAERYGKKLGDPEYQFSDGPAGYRAHSWDYPSLEAGMADLCKDGAVIIWDEDDPEDVLEDNTNEGGE